MDASISSVGESQGKNADDKSNTLGLVVDENTPLVILENESVHSSVDTSNISETKEHVPIIEISGIELLSDVMDHGYLDLSKLGKDQPRPLI